MKKVQIVVFICCLFIVNFLPNRVLAQQIIKAEYFFDNDPGFGNATSISLTPSANIANLNITIDYSSLNIGNHLLSIRTLDSAGNWSLTNHVSFYNAPKIVALEYFIDTDPGFGHGTALPINTPSANLNNIQPSFSLIGLPSGVHSIYIRSKDETGQWSLTNKQSINYCPSGTSYFYQDIDHDGYGTLTDSVLACTVPVGYASNHTDCDDNDSNAHQKFPFYIDNDGDNYGNGNLMMVCAQNDTTPPPGYGLNFGDCNDNDATSHQEFPFYIDNDGDLRGAGTTTYLFCAPAAHMAPPGYSTNNTDCDDNNPDGHFFIPFYVDLDGDGFGASANTVMLCSNTSAINYPPVGYTFFSYGVDCNDNDWDLRMSFPFYVDADQDGYGIGNPVQVCAINPDTPPIGYSLQSGDCNDNEANIYPGKIDLMEYYIDTDPGAGQGIALDMSGLNFDSLSATFPIIIPNSLQPGFHLLAIRAHTCGLNWGLFEQRSFDVSALDISTGPLVAGEYFIDTDPGVGNGFSFTIPGVDTLLQQLSLSVPSNTAPGIHAMGIRMKDSLGQWSHFETTYISVYPPPEPTYPIVAAEYFIDTDPGVGKAIPLTISPTDTLSQVFGIVVPGNLSEGIHLLSVRVKNSQNEWSLFEHRSIYITAPLQDPNPIVAAEYFIDTDPGLGNAIVYPVSLLDTLQDTLNIPLPNNLSYGPHHIAIRVKDQTGNWSLFEQQTFYYKEPPSFLPGSGHAITLDGNDDYIQLPPILNGAQQFTIDFWIKTSENRSNGTFWQKPTIIGNANPSAPDGDFGITTDHGQLGVWSGFCCGDQAMQTTTSIHDNQWHHVAAVNNGSQLVLYVDGILLPGSIPTNNGSIQNIARPWRIGMNNSCCSGGSPHAGTVDEFRFWNIALSETQLRERMCRKITDSDPLYNNMAAYFNFDETATSNAIDASKEPNIATLQNGANRILSGAPIGNTSAYIYNGNSSALNLIHPTRGDQMDAAVVSGNASGLQLYCVTERPNTQMGIDTLNGNDAYYGVFTVNGNAAQVQVTHHYTGVPNITNENALNLYQRERNDNSPWSNSLANLNTINHTLSSTTTYRQEFMLGVIPTAISAYHIKSYLQGYFEVGGLMRPVLNLQGQNNMNNETDSITLEFRENVYPYQLLEFTRSILHTDGTATFQIPASLQGMYVYLLLKHRNHLETWSAEPVLITANSTYDFSTAANKAYGSNQIQVENGIWAFFTGDMNQDGVVDGLDYNDWENDSNNFAGGYLSTDLNGDGIVDGLDFIYWEQNSNNFVGAVVP
jgi:hypothetical protein